MLLKACLNGARHRSDHPACPITSGELAAAAQAVVTVGAAALHIHPRDDEGNETLAASHVAAALEAVRERVSEPVGISTGAWFLPDPADRLNAIERWDVLPDFASVNFHEAGATAIARALRDRGVGVEAGIWTADAATVLAESGLAPHCVRLLIEPMEQDLGAALANVKGMEDRLDGVGPAVPRLLHGVEATAWPVLDHARLLGHDTRIGLEDTLRLPDGTVARDNTELVQLAATRLHLRDATT